MPEFDSTLEYRDIHGHPGYKVGNDGSAWTCKKFENVPNRGGMKVVLGDFWFRMKPQVVNKLGHLAITLRPSSKRALLHRLVLEAFVGPCPLGLQGRHFPDRDPANNHISNLGWATAKQNMADKIVHGTSNRGEGFYAPKLNNFKIKAIKKLEELGMPRPYIAKRFGVNQSAISRAISGKSWSHVT